MSDSFAYIDIILFAMVAAFIALRLRGVLGKKTGQERQRPSGVERAPVPAPAKAAPDFAAASLDAEGRIADPADAATKQGLAAIRLADHGFDLDGFLQGSKGAFTLITEAFAKGERETLRPLLAPDVFERFEAVIAEREAKGEVHAAEVVAVPGAEIAEAGMNGRRARIAVRFRSEQIGVVKNAAGEIVEGDPSSVEEVLDVWTFERDTRSPDPNWELVETRSPA
ncbi:MAG: Tim44 domain-containing protein [Geminicoccaceae bacterium]|nr:Tim44 domain-containing protein [Geminicoccaceae bacterium]